MISWNKYIFRIEKIVEKYLIPQEASYKKIYEYIFNIYNQYIFSYVTIPIP